MNFECRSCGELKPATNEYFAKDGRKPRGISTECKSCTAARSKAHRRGIKCTKERADNAHECTVCKVTKPLTAEHFYPVQSRLTNFDVMCRDCRNDYHRKHRRETKTDETRAKDNAKSKQKYQEAKRVFVEYKGGKCEHCGVVYDYTNSCIFDFHHIDPSTKEYEIGKRSLNFEKTKPELDKCILLCSNCHRKIHSDKF